MEAASDATFGNDVPRTHAHSPLALVQTQHAVTEQQLVDEEAELDRELDRQRQAMADRHKEVRLRMANELRDATLRCEYEAWVAERTAFRILQTCGASLIYAQGRAWPRR
jgi:hypothetical protein